MSGADEPYQIAPAVRCGADVVQLLQRFLRDDPREVFRCGLPGRSAPADRGALRARWERQGNAPVHPREVFRSGAAGFRKRARRGPQPPERRRIAEPRTIAPSTERLQQVGELMGIEVLDHLVIGGWSVSTRSRTRGLHAIGGLGRWADSSSVEGAPRARTRSRIPARVGFSAR